MDIVYKNDFFTFLNGQVDGDIKRLPKDFVVKEIIAKDVVCDEIHKVESGKKKDSFIFLMNLYNWDHFKAISYIASSLEINKSQIGFSGTKDKKAVTYQLISIDDVSGVSLKDVERLRIKDINLTFLGKGENLHLGDLWGNRFCIRVYFDESDLKAVRSMFHNVGDEIYFPNYFGPQRFGTNRPVSHIVGRHIINSDVKEAVMSYLSYSVDSEDKKICKAREIVQSGDFDGALLAFPDVMHYEKVMLSYLIQNPDDYEGAFRTFPLSMRKMFVHAYQSYLFNRVLSKIITVGDYDMNMVVPIFGYGLKFIKDSRIRVPMQEVLREEDLDLCSFRVDVMPYLSSKGGLRTAFEKAHNFKSSVYNDGYVDVEFDLLKGCYATVMLREFFNL